MFEIADYIWVRWRKSLFPAIVCDPATAPEETVLPDGHLYLWWPGSPKQYGTAKCSTAMKFTDPAAIKILKNQKMKISQSLSLDVTCEYAGNANPPRSEVIDVIKMLRPFFVTSQYAKEIVLDCLDDLTKAVDANPPEPVPCIPVEPPAAQYNSGVALPLETWNYSEEENASRSEHAPVLFPDYYESGMNYNAAPPSAIDFYPYPHYPSGPQPPAMSPPGFFPPTMPPPFAQPGCYPPLPPPAMSPPGFFPPTMPPPFAQPGCYPPLPPPAMSPPGFYPPLRPPPAMSHPGFYPPLPPPGMSHPPPGMSGYPLHPPTMAPPGFYPPASMPPAISPPGFYHHTMSPPPMSPPGFYPSTLSPPGFYYPSLAPPPMAPPGFYPPMLPPVSGPAGANNYNTLHELNQSDMEVLPESLNIAVDQHPENCDCVSCVPPPPDADDRDPEPYQPLIDAIVEEIQDAEAAIGEQPQPGGLEPPPAKRRRRHKALTPEQFAARNPMGPPCQCRMKCYEIIGQRERVAIYEGYIVGSYHQRLMRIREWAKDVTKERERLRGQYVDSRRERTFEYRFSNAEQEKTMVCKLFFMGTLGLKSDSMIRKAIDSAQPHDYPGPDRRGTSPNPRRVDTEIIKQHVETTFKPTVSHYRREHAPRRRYLPSDLNRTVMWKLYREHTGNKIAYESYRVVFDSMGISFAVLGNEECETCDKFKKQHEEKIVQPHDEIECDECLEQAVHVHRYQYARDLYAQDRAMEKSPDVVAVSADLQKVIMLPRLPGIKSCLFTPRVIAYNETFSLLGPQEMTNEHGHRTMTVLWHEGTATRSAQDIANAFFIFIQQNKDVKCIKIWLDNCSSQNKNWTLYSAIVIIINNAGFKLEEATLKYFEAGHTFMSADSVHAAVEKSLKQMGQVQNFADFVEAAGNAMSGNILTKEMKFADCREWTNNTSASLLEVEGRPLLRDLATVQFRRGKKSMFFKKDHEEAEFQEFQFMGEGVPCRLPPRYRKPQGIPRERKAKILKNLGPHLDDYAKRFWERIPIRGATGGAASIDEGDNDI